MDDCQAVLSDFRRGLGGNHSGLHDCRVTLDGNHQAPDDDHQSADDAHQHLGDEHQALDENHQAVDDFHERSDDPTQTSHGFRENRQGCYQRHVQWQRRICHLQFAIR